MDCGTYLNLLDSSLCGELLVETYHYMLSHADDCPACRCELMARMRLRAHLRQACGRTQASPAFHARLRMCLHGIAGSDHFAR